MCFHWIGIKCEETYGTEWSKLRNPYRRKIWSSIVLHFTSFWRGLRGGLIDRFEHKILTDSVWKIHCKPERPRVVSKIIKGSKCLRVGTGLTYDVDVYNFESSEGVKEDPTITFIFSFPLPSLRVGTGILRPIFFFFSSMRLQSFLSSKYLCWSFEPVTFV